MGFSAEVGIDLGTANVLIYIKRKTITNAANALKELGAKDVYACATHPILSGPAIERITNSEIKELVLLNTAPIPEEKQIEKIKVLSVAPLFAEAMTRVFNNDSISRLFD